MLTQNWYQVMSDRLEQLSKLYDADPNDPFCTYGIALEHAKAQRYDEALEWLDKTLGLDSQYCYAFYQKAKALSAMGQDGAAREILKIGMETATQAGDDHARSEMAELLDTLG